MAELKLSDDGLYYWDGRQWISTLSFDGHFRWNGSAWVPVSALVAPPYPYYQPPTTVRVPTRWTKPLQYAVVAWYLISGLYALSLPFWMSSMVSQIVNQSIQQSTTQNPDVSPPPPEVISSMTSTMTAIMTASLWAGALIGFAIAVVAIVGALKRWTWVFYVVLVLLGLGALSLPLNFARGIGPSTMLTPYQLPSWMTWISIAIGIPGAALFVLMLVAAIRYGPWATTKTSSWPQAATAPAS